LGGVGNLVALFIFGARKQMMEFAFCAVATVVFAAACTMFARRLNARNRYLTDSNQIIQAPEAIAREVGALLEPVAARMSFDLSMVNLYIGRRMFTATPSIVESGGRLHLIMPLGFLKVLRESPEVARAMLAHEIGHADQQDTKLWPLANIYWSVTMKTFMPLIGAILLVQLISTVPAVINAREAELRAEQAERVALEENDRLLAQGKREIQEREYPEPGFYAGEIQDRDSDIAFAEYSHQMQEMLIKSEADRGRSAVEDTLIGASLQAMPIALQAGLVLLMLQAIRRLRRLSEEMADLAVVIYDDGQALQRALKLFGKASEKWRPFSIHPSTQWRLRRIVEECRAVGSEGD
jgi:hypothetical protein